MEPNIQPAYVPAQPAPSGTKMTPKDFFLHIGMIVVLYTSVGILLGLLFQVINRAFPQVNSYYGYYGSTISWPVAALIVLFPLFLVISLLIERDAAAVPEKRHLSVRKWLLYITLFLSGATIVGDLIAVLYKFLDGQELTTGFFLKVLSVLVVAGLVFGYYFSVLRPRGSYKTLNRAFAIIAACLVVGSIVWGFAVIGSPRSQRMMRYDDQKTSDLSQIQQQVIYFWQQKSALPANLEALKNDISGYSVPLDAQTSQMYEYKPTGPMSFELCATFNKPSRPNAESKAYYYGNTEGNWDHGEGRTCFTRTIDPQLYPSQRPVDVSGPQAS